MRTRTTAADRAAPTGVLAALAALLVALLGTLGAAPATADGTAGPAGSGHGRMMLVLDSSGSMKEPTGGGSSKIAAAKKALDQVVDGLPADAAVGMRVYGATVFSKSDRGACTDSQLVVEPGTSNRDALRTAIGKYKPYGETPTGYALQQAAKDLGDEGQRSIVLVSDGEATCAPDPCKVATKLAQQGIDLHIDVVGLGVTGKARKQLQCVAAQGNGTYYGVDSAEQIVSSLSRVARRAVRPFTLEGTPIKGSPDAKTPTPITQGVWTDTVPAYHHDKDGRDTLHYAYTRTIPGSTLHVSAVTLGEPDGSDAIGVDMKTGAGYPCGSGNALRQLVRFGAVGAEALSQDGPLHSGPGPCATAKKLLIDVNRNMPMSKQAAPVQVLVAEEPPVRHSGSLPAGFDGDVPVAGPGTGTPQPVTGGNSFPDAALVGPGSYAGTIVPGEATMFRVHLGWGQRLAVRFDFPKAAPALRQIVGTQGPFADLKIYDPLRSPISDLIQDASSTDFAAGASAGHVDSATYPVRYRNRSTAGTYSALAGDYYVGLNVARDTNHGTYELPYTMHVEVIGKPTGAPTYTTDPGWTVAEALGANAGPIAAPTDGATTGDASATDSSPASARQHDSSTTKYVVAGVLVLLALAAGGGALVLLRRRVS